jgi:hypothetical protein
MKQRRNVAMEKDKKIKGSAANMTGQKLNTARNKSRRTQRIGTTKQMKAVEMTAKNATTL